MAPAEVGAGAGTMVQPGTIAPADATPPDPQGRLHQAAGWALKALGASGIGSYSWQPPDRLAPITWHGVLGPEQLHAVAGHYRDRLIECALQGERAKIILPDAAAAEAPYLAAIRATGARMIMALPLMDAEVGGVLVIVWSDPKPRIDEALVSLIASQAALGIGNLRLRLELDHESRRAQLMRSDVERLHDRARQAAALEQRQALACDLHDSVMQTLFSLRLAAQVALDSLERSPAQTQAALETVLHLTRNAGTEMRTLLFELRDSALASEGLAHALERYVDLVRRHSNLWIDLHVSYEVSLPARYEESIYRLVQEGLTNVVKHAHATRASIILTTDQAEIILRVEDDGTGFITTDPECESCGLRLMRERVSKLGGTFHLGNRREGGAYLRVALPVPEEHT